jgi:hypothetical protein
MDSKNLTIGVLSVTATILLVGVILMSTVGQQPAMGYGQVDRGGDYVLLTSQWRTEHELLWVLDGRSRALGMYFFDPRRSRLELVATLDLTER